MLICDCSPADAMVLWAPMGRASKDTTASSGINACIHVRLHVAVVCTSAPVPTDTPNCLVPVVKQIRAYLYFGVSVCAAVRLHAAITCAKEDQGLTTVRPLTLHAE